MKRAIAVVPILMICLQMAACDTGKSGSGSLAYIAEESITFPAAEAVMAETVYDNTLIYCAADMGGEAAGSLSIYQRDMTDKTAEPVKIPYQSEPGEAVQAMAAAGNGTLHMVSVKYDEETENTAVSQAFWKQLDREGQTVASYDITQYFRQQEYAYASGMIIDASENVYISIGSDIYGWNKNGGFLFQTAGSGYISQLCYGKNGRVYAILSGGHGLELAEVDPQIRGLGVGQDISRLGSWTKAAPGIDGDILFACEGGVFEYDSQKKEFTEKLNWLSLDMAADYMGSLLPLADGRILWLSKDYQSEIRKTELMVIREMTAAEQEQAEKEVLTLGGVMYINATIRKTVSDFNKSNEDYRIEIREYGTEQYSDEGIAQLNADIISGKGPDILILPHRFSLDIYADKGVLEDLYPYMEKDPSTRPKDFQENIIKAYEREGKLYGIPIFYFLSTVTGKESDVGDRSSWNLDELISFADSCPAGCEIFDDASKTGVLQLCLKANVDQMVDWTAEGSGFNRELFIKMLQFANRFTDDDKYTYDEDFMKRIEADQLLLWNHDISSASLIQLYRAMFGEQITYAGYPSEEGSGTLIFSTAGMAISSKCANKEIAWEFISSLLSEEVQADSSLRGFPIRKSGLAKQMERVMEATYYTDSKGNKKEQSQGLVGSGDFVIDMYAATPEDVEAVMKIIESATKLRSFDDQISKIIAEESGLFFSGSKTAEEAADVVENRIGIYVKEMK